VGHAHAVQGCLQVLRDPDNKSSSASFLPVISFLFPLAMLGNGRSYLDRKL
jgi:hypothetical protein